MPRVRIPNLFDGQVLLTSTLTWMNRDTIDHSALVEASELVKRDLGGLSDLPDSLQNTLANTYYEYCLLLNKTARYNVVFSERDVIEGTKRLIDDFAHVKSAVLNLPELIRLLRLMDRNEEEYAISMRFLIDHFKYRIPNVDKKSPIRLLFERPFYACRVREIPNLYSLMQKASRG